MRCDNFIHSKFSYNLGNFSNFNFLQFIQQNVDFFFFFLVVSQVQLSVLLYSLLNPTNVPTSEFPLAFIVNVM